MALVNLTSSSNFSRTLSLEDNSDSIRDVSFSSYVSPTEESFVRKLAESNPYWSQINNPTPDHQELEHHNLETKKEEDGEIGVFSAEKYFKGGMDDSGPRLINMSSPIQRRCQLPKTGHEQSNDAVAPMMTTKYHSATPSVISDQSSWNSQSALLQGPSRIINPPQRKTSCRAQYSKRFLAALGCKCSDKESVNVDEHVGEISFKNNSSTSTTPGKSTLVSAEHIKPALDLKQKSRSGSCRVGEDIHCKTWDHNLGIGVNNKETCFSFPSQLDPAVNVKKHQEMAETKPLKKVVREVLSFSSRSRSDQKSDSSSILERRPEMFSLPRMEEMDLSAPAGCGVVYDENYDSDASSDLFEIDSLTGKINPFLARQGSDATSCYAASEASIEWSVVTASAADFSVTSDYEELISRPPTMCIPSPINIKAFPGARGCKEMTTPRLRRPSNLLLGCKSQKAVRVAGDAHSRSNGKPNLDQRMSRVSDSYMPVYNKKVSI